MTDDGGQITSPTTPTNTLLTAFGGPDRYLGLTITVSNGVSVSDSEISPRQQLASAPYAVQAQTANTVGPLGVTSIALASGSVVAGKLAANAVSSSDIADNAVATAKIADGAVTTAKLATGAVAVGKIAAAAVTTAAITNGAVTVSKMNINGDLHMNGYSLYLNPGVNHGLAYNGSSFAGNSLDGLVLWGFDGGLLGTVNGGNKVALEWQNDKSVTMNGDATVEGAATMNGSVTMRGGKVSMFGPLESRSFDHQYTETTDGFVLFSGDSGHWRFRLWNANGTAIWTNLSPATQAGPTRRLLLSRSQKGRNGNGTLNRARPIMGVPPNRLCGGPLEPIDRRDGAVTSKT